MCWGEHKQEEDKQLPSSADGIWEHTAETIH